MPALFLKESMKPSREILDVLGYQTGGQAVHHATGRDVRERHQSQRFEESLRIPEQVRTAPE
jgi:hypothetical protein